MSDHDLLIQISAKLDTALLTVRDQEQRLRQLERRVWVATGAAAVALSGVGTLWSALLSR